MLYAAVEIAPVFGGTLLSVDSASAEVMPGVKRVVQLDEAVAVSRTAIGALDRPLLLSNPRSTMLVRGTCRVRRFFLRSMRRSVLLPKCRTE